MSGYLSRLVDRIRPGAGGIRPRPLSRFESPASSRLPGPIRPLTVKSSNEAEPEMPAVGVRKAAPPLETPLSVDSQLTPEQGMDHSPLLVPSSNGSPLRVEPIQDSTQRLSEPPAEPAAHSILDGNERRKTDGHLAASPVLRFIQQKDPSPSYQSQADPHEQSQPPLLRAVRAPDLTDAGRKSLDQAGRRMQPAAQGEPRIRIHIGRIEVTAVHPAARPEAPKRKERSAGMSLDEYLQNREKEKRR